MKYAVVVTHPTYHILLWILTRNGQQQIKTTFDSMNARNVIKNIEEISYAPNAIYSIACGTIFVRESVIAECGLFYATKCCVHHEKWENEID